MAFGIGVDSLCVESVIRVGVPRTMESFFQESGRTGRDGRLANNNDIGCNMYIEGMQPIMKDYCKNIKKTMQEENCAKPLFVWYFKYSRETQLL